MLLIYEGKIRRELISLLLSDSGRPGQVHRKCPECVSIRAGVEIGDVSATDPGVGLKPVGMRGFAPRAVAFTKGFCVPSFVLSLS